MKQRHIRKTRILLGLLVMLAFGVLYDVAPIAAYPPYRLFDFFWIIPGLVGGGVLFLSASVGAYVARTDFRVPAVFFVAATWLIILHMTYEIANSFPPNSLREIVAANSIGVLVNLAGAYFGAVIGNNFYEKSVSKSAVAA